LWIGVILWISFTLVYKADRLVTKFKLDANINEPSLNVNFSSSSIIMIALIVTAAIILINEIPNFCRLIYNIYHQKSYALFANDAIDWSPIIVSVIKIIIALLILGERKRILDILSPVKVSDSGQNE
jgi:hypothetical protein